MDKVEKSLKLTAGSESKSFSRRVSSQNDEVDLQELFCVIWGGRWLVLGGACLLFIIGLIYAQSLPNLYRAESIFVPTQSDSGASGLASQYGGLATIAGINFGGAKNDDIDQAVVLVKSWPFLEGVIKKYNLSPFLAAVEGWEKNSQRLVWNDEIFDAEAQSWLKSNKTGKSFEPTSFESYEAFSSIISIRKEDGLLRLSVEFFSPQLAAEWVRILAAELNLYFQVRDMHDARQNIDYLTVKISETGVSQMQSVFYGMIESQMKVLMLAEVKRDYLMTEIVPAKVPERKSAPNRKIIVMLGGVLGFFLSLLFLVFRYILIKN